MCTLNSVGVGSGGDSGNLVLVETPGFVNSEKTLWSMVIMF